MVSVRDAKSSNKYMCIDCGETLVPRKGEVVSHHYSHLANSSCSGESWQHKWSKNLISNNINWIVFEQKCLICKRTCEYQCSSDNFTCKEESPVDNYIVDVAVYSPESMLVAMIEVWHTHKVGFEKSDSLHDYAPLLEVRTEEVIRKLESGPLTTIVNLRCVDTDACGLCIPRRGKCEMCGGCGFVKGNLCWGCEGSGGRCELCAGLLFVKGTPCWGCVGFELQDGSWTTCCG